MLHVPRFGVACLDSAWYWPLVSAIAEFAVLSMK